MGFLRLKLNQHVYCECLGWHVNRRQYSGQRGRLNAGAEVPGSNPRNVSFCLVLLFSATLKFFCSAAARTEHAPVVLRLRLAFTCVDILPFCLRLLQSPEGRISTYDAVHRRADVPFVLTLYNQRTGNVCYGESDSLLSDKLTKSEN